MILTSKLTKNSSNRSRRIFAKAIMLPIFFLLLCIPVFAHYYSLSPSSTTNGGGTWGAILRMSGSISGNNVTFTVQKTSGTFSLTNSVYLKVGTYESYGVNRATGTIYAGGSQWSHTHDLSAYSYPKQFYFRVVSTDGYAWVGPITVYYNNNNPNNHTVISEPTSGSAGQSLTYSYRISDPDNDRVKIHISWGDGSSTWDSGLRSSNSTVSGSHSYGSVGTYNLYTTVFDEHGADSNTRHVQVNISEGVPPTPSPPTVKATGPTSVYISWNSVPGAAKYTVWRSTSAYGTYKQIFCSSPTNYTDSGSHLSPNTTYYYKIRAGNNPADCYNPNSSGWSGYSGYTSVKTDRDGPPKPGKPSVTATGPTTVKISWNSVDGAVKYTVWRSTSAYGTYKQIYCSSPLSYTDSGSHLSPGTTYYYKIRAGYSHADCANANSSGWSEYSDYDWDTTTTQGPTAAFYGTPTSGSSPLTVQFYDQSTAGSGASISSWHWEFGDGTTSSNKNPSHTYNSSGSYTVKLTVTNSYANVDTETKSSYITVSASTPTAGFYGTPTSGNAPLTVQFYDQSQPGEGASITLWYWDFGDGTTASGKNPTHTYNNPGMYNVRLTVQNSSGYEDSETKNGYITVTEPGSTIKADFYGHPTYGDVPLTVQFYDQSSPSSGASITGWEWNFGDGSGSSSKNPTHQYTSPGTYSVTLNVTDSKGSQATKTKTGYITVNSTSSTPTANFTGLPPSGSTPLIVQFYDQSSPGSSATITDWKWDFGDGKTSSSKNPKHTYSKQGKYTVKLTVTNSSGNKNTRTKTNYINACSNCLLYRLPFPSGIKMNITNGYGDGLHTGRDQYCVDFNLTGQSDAGIPVLAVADGKVTYAQWNTGGYGFRVVVDHGNGITSNYSHGASINVSKGDFVQQGQELMVIWDTGKGGYHLHFGMYKNGKKLELKNFSGCPSGCTFNPKNSSSYTSDNVINNPGKIIEENQADISGSIDGNESYYGHNRKYSWKYAKEGTSTTTATYRPRFSKKVTCDIFVYIPPFNATTTAAKYKVKHVGGTETFTINQLNVPASSIKPDNWVHLGNKTFEFGSGSNYYVQVGNGVDSYKKDQKVGFDAVYFKINESGGGGGEPTGTPRIGLNRTTFNFGAIASGVSSDSGTLFVNNIGKGTLRWTATGNASWLNISPNTGTNSGTINISVNSTGLSVGTYTGAITISDPNASNSPRIVSVTLKVHQRGWTGPPFGDFSTPDNSSKVRSSVPVTGWALDDVGIASVKIYNGNKYIGDAVFVDGARPDIEQAYPGYPMNSKSGWGYLMLTNFLPKGGNGRYVIKAKATDKEGNTVTLGSKTIYCDNANAFKPFGAIDTPAQGGPATGKEFTNWGWVLTPQPNYIPTNGSTIKVYVDGVNIGRPVYNIYRSDIANLFPGYANSSGAIGYYTLDTTVYKNGVHTIQWVATDNAGNTDGIGSRYFTIQNRGTNGQQSLSNVQRISVNEPVEKRIPSIPVNYFEPVIIEKGSNCDTISEIYPDENGDIHIETREMERAEIHLGCPGWKGYHMIGDQLRPLPVGSTLDTGRGIFYWQPGPGFIGEYRLVFISREEEGELLKKTVKINIRSKFKE